MNTSTAGHSGTLPFVQIRNPSYLPSGGLERYQLFGQGSAHLAMPEKLTPFQQQILAALLHIADQLCDITVVLRNLNELVMRRPPQELDAFDGVI